MPNNGFDGPEEKHMKIAQVTFAYENKEVINWLTARGKLIKTEKWDKVAEINQTIHDGIQKPDLLDKM